MDTKATTKRDPHLDLIRVIAMLFVIAIHTSWEYSLGIFPEVLLRSTLFTANGLFFLLSGHLSLNFKEDPQNPGESYRNFYWKKYCSLILPLIFYCAVLVMYSERHLVAPGTFVTELFWKILPSSREGHIWFIYSLIAYIMAAPFVSIMLRNLSITGLRLFFGIAIVFEAVSVMLFSNIIESPFTITGWPFLGWYFYFLCGFLIYKLEFFHKKKVFFIILGAVCLIITACLIAFVEKPLEGTNDTSPVYLFACIGLYLLLESVPVPKILNKPLEFISKHAYAVYLIHIEVLVFVRTFMPVSTPLSTLLCVLTIAAISIAIAFICDSLVLSPITKVLTKSGFKVKAAFITAVTLITVIIPIILIIIIRAGQA
ncbi:MAG: acyltransferase [Clostridiales bacterium]|nr:acyltransferase [Clostridiales bacterium]